MAEDYGRTDETLTRPDFLAGSHPTVMMFETIGSGAGDLSAGQVLGRQTANGKLYKYSAAASDGTEVAVGVLARAIDASSADAKVVVYVHGEFRRAKLDWNSATSGQIDAEILVLTARGIFIKAEQV